MDDPSTYDGGVLLVLEEQLRRELDRIEERRRDLAASRELLSKVTSIALGATELASEPISDAIAPSVVNRLLSETTGLLRNFVLTISEGPALDESTMRCQRGPDPARRAAAGGLPGERAVLAAGPALDDGVGRGG